MPRLRVPKSLRKAALDGLAAYFADYVDQLCVNRALSDVRQAIVLIKEYTHPCLPPRLYNEVCRKFLTKFLWIQRNRNKTHPASHNRAALEVLMDLDIVGLQCVGEIMKYFDPADAGRFRRLSVLKLHHVWNHIGPKSLENFDLRNLIELHVTFLCVDRDLEIVGANCPKLLVLHIEESRRVTDNGLKALRPCSELRVLCVAGCQVTDTGINELLSTNKKIIEFNIGRHAIYSAEESFDVLSRPRSLVCPFMKRFSIKCHSITDEHLHAIVELFPNLTYLRINGEIKGDLCTLKRLDKLIVLNFIVSRYNYQLPMDNMNELLTSIGKNITMLNLKQLTQAGLNFICKVCVNIEHLTFHYPKYSPPRPMVVPSFRKLKMFECIIHPEYTGDSRILEFSTMPELRHLRCYDEVLSRGEFMESLELILFDHKRFPNLKTVFASGINAEICERMNQAAKQKNINFFIQPY
ncbi:uncharacterized protein LOC124188063 isoform X3 [Neodiprion fabricii]|uniref:uncharacterized protein LOC124188063 isoform X3 n=1 Tax=Neodiprion fabricii TaxID=2872261 RepID=UPI001ED92FF0|nr:uncharacterized protein LOC124188063 isoform X3 [Neodiprion fabricii]XP_046436344.1 uncharacterized protein LOC124188063 isoform X3 [Neodiprion fabricii]